MAKCRYEVWTGDALTQPDQPPRHVCEEHYYAWRDGERSGPAHVEGSADCKRVCEDCKAELAAAKAAPKEDT